MQQTRSYKAEQVIERLKMKAKNRQIMLSLAACVHCGMCTDQCHYVLANPDDPTYAPAYKADKIRKLFKAHIDWTGKVAPWWVGARSVYTDGELEELKDTVFGKCTNCRRCSLNCPMGVDMASFNRMARGLLCHVGVMPDGVAVVAKDQWEIGNQMGVLQDDYLDTLDWMQEKLQTKHNDESIRIPVDVPDCNVVYSINPREAKYDPRSIADAAEIFHFAGEKWCMPSEGWDMTNFGLFNGDDNRADIEQGWEMVQRNVNRVSGMILDMLYCAKDRTPRRLPVSVSAVAREVVELFTQRARDYSVALDAELGDVPDINAEPKDIHALISNLVSNAIDACCSDETEDKPHRVLVTTAAADGHAFIKVQHNGIGMDRETRTKLFAMFFSTKGAFGTGLGLLVSHKVVTEHGGAISVESTPGQGAVFTVKLPYNNEVASSE